MKRGHLLARRAADEVGRAPQSFNGFQIRWVRETEGWSEDANRQPPTTEWENAGRTGVLEDTQPESRAKKKELHESSRGVSVVLVQKWPWNITGKNYEKDAQRKARGCQISQHARFLFVFLLRSKLLPDINERKERLRDSKHEKKRQDEGDRTVTKKSNARTKEKKKKINIATWSETVCVDLECENQKASSKLPRQKMLLFFLLI